MTGVALLIGVIAPKEGARLVTSIDDVRKWQALAGIPAEEFYVLRAVEALPVLEKARETGAALSRALRRARIPTMIGLGLTAAEASLLAFFSVGLA